ncbi:flavin reductase family protein [Rhodococcus koreensis]|uniref:flavin reductase family protein n=1 Tax=Rhodococcus koreensis TaxID=99653 RepID=UPI003672A13E
MRTPTSPHITATTPEDIADAYRTVLGKFCTGVVAVTALDDTGNPVGLTVGSFSSVSLDPALVAFFVGRGSTTFPKVAASGRFCANILSADQHELGRAFARSGTDKFRGIDWTPATTGSPRLAGAHAWIDCHIDLVQPVGDHDLVVGRVVELGATDTPDPLLFYTSTFHQLTPARPA